MSETPQSLLLVRHGEERLGIDLAAVREVLRVVHVRPLPGAPAGVLGVINLRGETIAVLDLEARIPAGAGRPGLDHHLVVLGNLLAPVAIAVTRVEDIEGVSAEAWRAADGALPKGVPVLGIARLGEEPVPVLDTSVLLDRGETMALKDAIRELVKAANG